MENHKLLTLALMAIMAISLIVVSIGILQIVDSRKPSCFHSYSMSYELGSWGYDHTSVDLEAEFKFKCKGCGKKKIFREDHSGDLPEDYRRIFENES